MDYISFYRKWRPQDFNQVIGQDYNIQTLKNALARKKLSHSYIFCGPRGTGKTSTARILAKALNCKEGITSQPCNRCDNCISISNGSSVDVIEIDAASNRGINEIRELREKVKYLPSILRKKVYIIDEVHMLTTEAFNALLKVLEEPPSHVVFIMATTEPNKVLPTIMSRCQRFDFYPISLEQIKKRLETIAKKEGIKVSKEALTQIARYSDGSLRDADGILEQLAAYSSDSIEASDVASLLGMVDIETLFKFTEIILEKNPDRSISFVKEILAASQNIKVFVSEFLDHLYNIYVAKNYKNPGEVIETGNDYLEKYMDQAKKLRKEEIEFYLEIFTDLLKQVRWGENAKIYFKTAVMRAVNFIVLDEEKLNRKTEALDIRIKNLENMMKKAGGGAGRYPEEEKDKKAPEMQGSGSPVEMHESPGEIEGDFPEGEKDAVISCENQDTGEVPGEDFDIINSGALEEPGMSGKGKLKQSAGKGTDGEDMDLVLGNLQKITDLLKARKISVQAMFIEAEPDRVEDGVIYFALDSSRKWHRDHLSKKENLDIISSVVREITGKKFQVKFELGGINNKNRIKNHYGQQQVSEEEVDFITGLPGQTMDNNGILPGESGRDSDIHSSPETTHPGVRKGKKPAGDTPAVPGARNKEDTGKADTADDNDILKYFEKKFNIKE